MKYQIVAAIFFVGSLSAQAFACREKCVNISGQPAYDATCRGAGATGQCDAPVFRGICAVAAGAMLCTNISGKSAYDDTCRNAGAMGQCNAPVFRGTCQEVCR